MSRKPEGYAEKLCAKCGATVEEGRARCKRCQSAAAWKWRARVTYTIDTCRCDHPGNAHPVAQGARRQLIRGGCTLCACPRYTPLRREWRRFADPNTKAVALDLARQRAKEIAEGGQRPELSPPPVRREERLFRDLAAEYIASYVKPPRYENGEKLSGMQDHKGVRSVIVNVLIPAKGKRPVEELTYAELRELRDSLLDAPKLRAGRNGHTVETTGARSLARVNRIMATLRAMLNHGVDLKWIVANPMNAGRGKSLVVMGAEKARERILTRPEELRMLAEYGGVPMVRSRDAFVMALDTGMRRGELLKLRVEHVHLDVNEIRLPWEITKTKKPRTLTMSGRVREIMVRRCAERAGEECVFSDLSETIIRDDFAAVRDAAEVTGLQLRDLRATLATRLLHAGISEAEISMMTGHRFDQRTNEAPVLRKHYLRLDADTLNRALLAIDTTNREAAEGEGAAEAEVIH